MADVYSNAFLTVVAMRAGYRGGGILQPRVLDPHSQPTTFSNNKESFKLDLQYIDYDQQQVAQGAKSRCQNIQHRVLPKSALSRKNQLQSVSRVPKRVSCIAPRTRSTTKPSPDSPRRVPHPTQPKARPPAINYPNSEPTLIDPTAPRPALQPHTRARNKSRTCFQCRTLSKRPQTRFPRNKRWNCYGCGPSFTADIREDGPNSLSRFSLLFLEVLESKELWLRFSFFS